MFAERLRMKQLAQTLERARTADEWWRLLIAAAREWNWVQLKWICPERLRRKRFCRPKAIMVVRHRIRRR